MLRRVHPQHGDEMTDPHDGPTIPSRFQKYPDARDDEYHSGGFICGLIASVVLVGALIGVGLAVSK